jgi:hypothetical protein
MDAIETRRFPFRVEPRYRGILRSFGVRPGTAYVELGEQLEAHFGWSHIVTPVSNITRWSIEGPWLALTAIGVRRGILDGVMSFSGTTAGGVRVDFRERPRYFFFRPPALYVAVEDPEGFAAALEARGIPGQDKRKRPITGG